MPFTPSVSNEELVGTTGRALMDELFRMSDRVVKAVEPELREHIPETLERYNEGLGAFEEIVWALSGFPSGNATPEGILLLRKMDSVAVGLVPEYENTFKMVSNELYDKYSAGQMSTLSLLADAIEIIGDARYQYFVIEDKSRPKEVLNSLKKNIYKVAESFKEKL